MQVLTYDRLFEFLQSKYMIGQAVEQEEDDINPVIKKLSAISKMFDDYLCNISYVELDIDSKLSVYASVLYLLNNDFILLNKKNVYLDVFFEKLLDDISSEKLHEVLGYKNPFKKSVDLVSLKQEQQLMLMSHYFDINIIVLNLDINKVEAVYLDKLFNRYRNAILILKSTDIYYPVLYNEGVSKKLTMIHNNTSDILEMITNVLRSEIKTIDINQKIFNIGGNDIFEDVNFGNNYTEIEDNEGDVDNIDIKEKHVSEVLVDKGDIFLTKKSKPNFNKNMKIKELQQIASEYKISLKTVDPKTGKSKPKTKLQLCKELGKL